MPGFKSAAFGQALESGCRSTPNASESLMLSSSAEAARQDELLRVRPGVVIEGAFARRPLQQRRGKNQRLSRLWHPLRLGHQPRKPPRQDLYGGWFAGSQRRHVTQPVGVTSLSPSQRFSPTSAPLLTASPSPRAKPPSSPDTPSLPPRTAPPSSPQRRRTVATPNSPPPTGKSLK